LAILLRDGSAQKLRPADAAHRDDEPFPDPPSKPVVFSCARHERVDEKAGI
jgi:hypothetical protein